MIQKIYSKGAPGVLPKSHPECNFKNICRVKCSVHFLRGPCSISLPPSVILVSKSQQKGFLETKFCERINQLKLPRYRHKQNKMLVKFLHKVFK